MSLIGGDGLNEGWDEGMIDGLLMMKELKISVVCEEGGMEGCEMVVVEILRMMGLNERN